jgi:hypothetical protein
MDPDKASLGDKSLRKRGKRILGAPFNAMGTLLGTKSKEARKPLTAPAEPPAYDGTWSSEGVGSSAPAEFLTKMPDPSWIDIEMIGYWLKKCNMEHGENCRRTFGLDPSRLGKPQWLIDVRRKCLTSAKPELRYACLSYVCE